MPTNEQLVIESNPNSLILSNSKFDYLTFNYTLDQLRKSTKYTFVVQSFNSEGAGPYSNEIFANTFNNGKLFKIHFLRNQFSKFLIHFLSQIHQNQFR